MRKSRQMDVEVCGVIDTFTYDDTQFAYKDGEIYDILVSAKSYDAAGCLGRIRIIVEGDSILHWMYPLWPVGEFEILNETKIKHFHDVITAYNKSKSNPSQQDAKDDVG